jgi:hypothetical protein
MEGNNESSPEQQRTREELPSHVDVVPLLDEVVEQHGFKPRSMYVETCWLPILGPTATLLYRRLGTWVEFNAEGLNVDMTDLSVSLGLGEGLGQTGKLARAIGRLTRFGAAEWRADQLAVRRALAPLPKRHVDRLSYSAFRLHEDFLRQIERSDPDALVR